MFSKNQQKHKTISSIVLITYTALLVVISFHFHDISFSEVSVSSAEKDFSANSGGDIRLSDGLCQFMLTYKSNADLSGITDLNLTIYLIDSKVELSEVNYPNSHTNNNNYLRAPPLTPLTLV